MANAREKAPRDITVGNRLRQMRKAKGWTIRETAALIDSEMARYSNWEQGIRRADIDDIIRLAKVFGCSAPWLAGMTDNDGQTTPVAVDFLPPENLYRTRLGEADSNDQFVDYVAFHTSYLRRESLDARELVHVKAAESSQCGTIKKGDELLIDRYRSAVTADGLYALFINGHIVFRWIRIGLDGTFSVYSYINEPKDQADKVTADELNSLEVIGRVCRQSSQI